MKKKDFRLVICDMPDKEELVCQVFFKNEQWIEISAETPNKFIVAFCNTDQGNYWEFPYEKAMEVLQEAKALLQKKQRTPEQQAEYDAMKKEQENWKPTPEETAEYERQMKEQWEKYYG